MILQKNPEEIQMIFQTTKKFFVDGDVCGVFWVPRWVFVSVADVLKAKKLCQQNTIHVQEGGFRIQKSFSIWMFPKLRGNPPKSSHFNRGFHYSPSILGGKHPYFRFNTHLLGPIFEGKVFSPWPQVQSMKHKELKIERWVLWTSPDSRHLSSWDVSGFSKQ